MVASNLATGEPFTLRRTISWERPLELRAAEDKLRRSGHKATPQRLAVLRALAAEQHQSLDELRGRCPEVGLVTVYRTLDLFSELGIVRRMDLGDRPRYEMAEYHHHHLICESCGSIAEFEACPVDPEVVDRTSPGFEANAHSLEVYGNCAGCR